MWSGLEISAMSRMVQLHPNPPHHTLLRSLNHTICDPFEDWQIVELVGVVLVGVGTPIVAIHCAAVPKSWGLPTMGGLSLKMGAFSKRGTLSKSSKRLSSCTALKKSCSIRWFTTSLPLVVSTRSLGSLIKAPKGSAATTSSASPIRGGVAPKGKIITPCPEIMLGVVTPHHSLSHSLVGQRECTGSLVSGSSVHTRRVLWVRGWGNQPSDCPFPLPGRIPTSGH